LLSSLIGVLLGDRMAELIPTRFLKAIAAAIFAVMAIKVLSQD
jgi:putative Ca2+/H+ antiporter (TMEM165/GDT1 family)